MTMTKIEIASDIHPSPAATVWVQACAILKRELGEATFASWVGQARLLEDNGAVVLVTPTGISADWIRRNAWRRIAGFDSLLELAHKGAHARAAGGVHFGAALDLADRFLGAGRVGHGLSYLATRRPIRPAR